MANPRQRDLYGPAWEKIARSCEVARRINLSEMFLEKGAAFDSELFDVARTIVRLVEEDTKPNAEHCVNTATPAARSLEQRLFSPAPIYPEYEEAKLAHSLGYWRRTVGESEQTTARVLGGRTPEEAAKSLVGGSKLADVAPQRGTGQGRRGGGGGVERPDDRAGEGRRRSGARVSCDSRG